MATALCPDCGRKIVIGPKPKKGQMISCPHCDVDLEIASISPLELDWVQFDDFDDEDIDIEEDDIDDWDDDDDFWDDDDDDEDELLDNEEDDDF